MSGLDLYLSQRVLAMMLVYAALAGFCLGGVYDVLTLAAAFLPSEKKELKSETKKRSSLAVKGFWTFWQDLIFLLLSAVTFILLCYYTNDGQLRAPAIPGMAGGFFVYRHTLGRLAGRLIPRLAAGIKRMLIRTVVLLLCPVRLLALAMYALFKVLWRVTGGRLVARFREKSTQKRVASLTKAASRGFDVLEDVPPSEKKSDSAV